MNENGLQNIREKREIITAKKNLTTEFHGEEKKFVQKLRETSS
jgi:hypothetical protein